MFTRKQLVAITIGVSIEYTGSLMALMTYWKFPIPSKFTVGGVLLMTMNTLVVITLGTTDRARLARYSQYANIVSAQAGMTLVYPVYNAIFSSLEGNAQLAFVLLLPVIKHALKYVTVKMHREYDDFLTALTATVEIFDALFMTKCMQSAGSLLVGVAVVFLNMAQNFVVIRRLDRQSRTLKAVKTNTEAHDIIQELSDALSWAADILVKTGSPSDRARPTSSHLRLIKL